jgi:hypothetical protein
MAKRKTIHVAFTYVVVTAVVVTCLGLYSLLAALTRWQSLVLLSGSLVVVWTIVFTILEMRRLAAVSGNSGQAADDEEEGLDFPRTVIVQPPTGEPYPHHEHHSESPGLDQGQLTSQLSDSTPLISEFIRLRRRNRHSH